MLLPFSTIVQHKKKKNWSTKMPSCYLPHHMLTASLEKVCRSFWPSQFVCCNNKLTLNLVSMLFFPCSQLLLSEPLGCFPWNWTECSTTLGPTQALSLVVYKLSLLNLWVFRKIHRKMPSKYKREWPLSWVWETSCLIFANHCLDPFWSRCWGNSVDVLDLCVTQT